MSYDIIILSDHTDIPKGMRPLGGHKIASFLRNEGYSVFVLNYLSDFYERGLLFKVLDKLIGDNTLMVGFSSTFYGLRRHNTDPFAFGELGPWPLEDDDMDLVLSYFRNKQVKTVYGGPKHRLENPRFYQDAIKGRVNYATFGFGESNMLDIIEDIKRSRNQLYVRSNETKLFENDLANPKFDFKHHKVTFVEEDFFTPTDVIPIEMARGCIFRCKFCNFELVGKDPRDDKHLRAKEAVIEEIMHLHNLFGTTNFQITDDTFNDNTAKLELIRDAVKELPFVPSFWAHIRADLVARFPQQIEILKDIGVDRWFMGVESLDYISAKMVGKGAKPEKILEMSVKVKEIYGDRPINRFGSFIIGLPNDNRERVEEWLLKILNTNKYFDSCQFSSLGLIPQTELGRDAEKFGYKWDTRPSIGGWSNQYWNKAIAHKMTLEVNRRNVTLGISNPHSHHTNILLSLGYDMKTIMSKPASFMTSLEVKERSEIHIDDYILSVLDWLNV